MTVKFTDTKDDFSSYTATSRDACRTTSDKASWDMIHITGNDTIVCGSVIAEVLNA